MSCQVCCDKRQGRALGNVMRALTETKVIRFFNHSHGPQNQDYQHRDKHQRGFTAGFVEDSHESPQLRQTCCVKEEVCTFPKILKLEVTALLHNLIAEAGRVYLIHLHKRNTRMTS